MVGNLSFIDHIYISYYHTYKEEVVFDIVRKPVYNVFVFKAIV